MLGCAWKVFVCFQSKICELSETGEEILVVAAMHKASICCELQGAVTSLGVNLD